MSAQHIVPQELLREKRHLNVLSNSAIACFRRCPREFQFRYVLLRRPRRASEALRFGTFFHIGLNAWWRVDGDADIKLAAAILAMQKRASEKEEDADPFDLAKATALMAGYSTRWGDAGFETVAVEQPFDVALVNPATGRESRTYRIQGKIDVIAKKDGRLYQVEHKTTSSDITPGADYWRKVSALDPQVSTYLTAARAAGFALDSCIYDVVRKIDKRQKLATPEESRRYTKGGKLDARQRLDDESVEEFFERCVDGISETPEKYYARGPIVRLEQDEREHAGDVWMTAWMIRESENAGRWPRSPNACERFHRWCDYFDVCSGMASIDDENRFRTAATPHEELQEV
jgi:hypothetical protein